MAFAARELNSLARKACQRECMRQRITITEESTTVLQLEYALVRSRISSEYT
jgi:hypothetical protein